MRNYNRLIIPKPTTAYLSDFKTKFHGNYLVASFFLVAILLVLPALLTTEGTTLNTNKSYSNTQNTSVLDGSSFDPLYGFGGAYISVIENSLTVDNLISQSNSVKTEEGGVDGTTINTYVIQEGDTISGIAEKFSVSQNTII